MQWMTSDTLFFHIINIFLRFYMEPQILYLITKTTLFWTFIKNI